MSVSLSVHNVLVTDRPGPEAARRGQPPPAIGLADHRVHPALVGRRSIEERDVVVAVAERIMSHSVFFAASLR
jgi:hypothetical protein